MVKPIPYRNDSAVTNPPRQSRMILGTAIILIAGAMGLASSPARADDEEASRRLSFDMAFDSEDFRRATMLGIGLEKDYPGHPLTRYKLACAYAMIERPLASGMWLKRAAEAGFADFPLASNDIHLASVRTDPSYMEALKLIRKNHDRGGGQVAAGIMRPIQYVPKDLAKEASSPLIVLLHGYGTDGHDIINPWKTLADEYDMRLVAPQGPHETEHGFRWGPVDESEPIVLSAIKYMEDEYRIDRRKIVLCGFSQGGLLAYALGVRHPKTFSGLIPIAGRFPGLDQAVKVPHAQYPRVFIMIGTKDRPLTDNRKAAKELEAAGYFVRLNEYEGVGHHLPQNFREEFRKALQYIWPS